MSDMKYYVGRVDGQGPIRRFKTRKEAEVHAKYLRDEFALPPEDVYLDGPPEPSEAEKLSQQLIDLVAEDKSEVNDLFRKAMSAETEEEEQKFIQELPQKYKDENNLIYQFSETKSGYSLEKAIKIALKMGMPLRLGLAIVFSLGRRVGRAQMEKEQLESLVG